MNEEDQNMTYTMRFSNIICGFGIPVTLGERAGEIVFLKQQNSNSQMGARRNLARASGDSQGTIEASKSRMRWSRSERIRMGASVGDRYAERAIDIGEGQQWW